jgi:M6 family metalloprotease-like protein
MKKRALYASLLFALSIILSFPAYAVFKAPLFAQNAIGTQRILVLAVLKRHVLDKTVKYYTLASYGKTQIIGDVKGWYPLPHSLEDYKVRPYNTEVDRSRVRRLVEDALNSAEKDISFNDYDHIVIVVGVHTKPGQGYGMIAYCANPGMLSKRIRYGDIHMKEITTRGGQHFQGGIIVVAQNAHQGHTVHDLAHALGGVIEGKRPIPDLYDTVLQGRIGPLSLEAYPKYTVFMGPWDVMSRHLIKYQQPPPGMSSFTRMRMGWIGHDQMVEVQQGENRAVTLKPLGLGYGTLMIKIPGRGDTYYLLENRQKVRSDWMVPTTGLLILKVDELREDGDGIVRVVDADPKIPDFGEATFGTNPGQTSTVILSDGIALAVLWQEEKDITVMITEQARLREVDAVAKLIRETQSKLNGMQESATILRAKAELSTARELLLQMKVDDARKKVEAILIR